MLRFELERVTNVITIVIDQHFFAYANFNGLHNAIIPFNSLIKANKLYYFHHELVQYHQTFVYAESISAYMITIR